jgi:glutamine synthetase
MPASPSDALKLGQQHGAQFVDLRFSDLPGLMQHFSMPFDEFGEEAFDEGIGFDGSSIRGFQEIQESDMILVPDPETAVMDPFRQHPTLILHAYVKDPVTGESYTRDPRYIAKKAGDFLTGTGIADTAFFGPEAEFYVFDSIRFDQNQHSAFYYIDAVEGVWNSGAEEGGKNLGYKPRYKEGYSRFLRWTTIKTCAPRWSSRFENWASRSRCTTTRLEPPARERSTWASRLSCRWPIG